MAEERSEEDALSLCDLPHIHQPEEENQQDNSTPLPATEYQEEDFDFCPLSRKEHEMCAADEVFHRGRILPLRDCSATSSDRSVTAADPSPSPPPKKRFSDSKQRTVGYNYNARKKSSAWHILRLGLVSTAPEITFRDLKNRDRRNTNRRNIGIRNSSHSRVSNDGVKRVDFFRGCRCCSSDAVRSEVVVIKRSGRCDGDEVRIEDEDEKENLLGQKSPRRPVSGYRTTSEWLKQLSLQGMAYEA
ncbi:hypothetical protein OROGR_001967 [Orobanche gracilis]